MPADPSFERLLQLGKQQGGLTPHDLQQVLDLERLSRMSFPTCWSALTRRAFRLRSIRHSSHQHQDAQAWPADPITACPKAAKCHLRCQVRRLVNRPQSNRKLRLLSFRISPATCVTKQFQLRSPSRSASLFC